MKTISFALLLVILGPAMAHAQAPTRLVTYPKLPPRDALERMKLAMPWTARVTVDGNRDGIASMQLIPDASKLLLIVQTHKGAVFLFDAERGDLIWKTSVGIPFSNVQPVAFNSQSIYVTRRNVLHALDRGSGAQQVFTYDPITKLFSYGWTMEFTPNATPIADEDFLYVPMANRVQSILLPDFEIFARARAYRAQLKRNEKGDVKQDELLRMFEAAQLDSLDSPQPDFYWGFGLADQLTTSSPLIYEEQISVLTTDGAFTSVNRYGKGGRIENFTFKTAGKVLGAAGQHQHVAYLASDDYNLYAVSMKGGELLWRHVSGAPLLTKPEVNDRDVFIAPKGVGLRRVDRLGGREVWTNRDTRTFLAANNHYVYALDQNGVLFVLDERRGTTLAKLDLMDWKIAIPNEWNDRIYLAANDGQVMCLRHKDLAKQLIMKTTATAKPKEEKKPIEEKKKEEEKKDEKEKDKDKDKDKDKEKDKAVKVGRQVAPPVPMRIAAPLEPALGRRVDADRDERRRRVGP